MVSLLHPVECDAQTVTVPLFLSSNIIAPRAAVGIAAARYWSILTVVMSWHGHLTNYRSAIGRKAYGYDCITCFSIHL